MKLFVIAWREFAQGNESKLQSQGEKQEKK